MEYIYLTLFPFRPEFVGNGNVNLCGAFHSTKTISSMSLNPYISGESVVALYNGSVYLWNSNIAQNVNDQVYKYMDLYTCLYIDCNWRRFYYFCPFFGQNSSSALQQVNLPQITGDNETWLQISFGAHPRQLYVASRSEVNLIDMRTKSSSTSR